jgi:hypothetical protein
MLKVRAMQCRQVSQKELTTRFARDTENAEGEHFNNF